jgi:hypothetical protein
MFLCIYLCAPFCVAMTVTLAPQRGHIGAHATPGAR